MSRKPALFKLFAMVCGAVILFLCGTSFASASGNALVDFDMTDSVAGFIAVGLFVIAYLMVMGEELLHMHKCKPVLLAAGFIWMIVAITGNLIGQPDAAGTVVRHYFLEASELVIFLFVAMTFVVAMQERQVFEKLRVWLIQRGFGYRALFWLTGILAFFISPIADNLTTALLMCAVVIAVGANSSRFVAIACVNIVVAANAGGAFSPFGDITTLMVWQKGILPISEFLYIFVPAVVSYLVPATIMHFAVPNEKPLADCKDVQVRYGGYPIIILFLITIVMTVSFHHFLHLPPFVGMLTGLGYLLFFAYHIRNHEARMLNKPQREYEPFDIFSRIEEVEWDTLLFFYGVILCVGGLAVFGYLEVISTFMYEDLGAALSDVHKATPANILVGFLSAIIDNIPVMFAVLTMNPHMSDGQWLLVTLTAGIGGSMLSIGSAAGVALMGQAKGHYTFMSHLKWSWAVALGYFAGVATHIFLNKGLF